MNIPAFSIWDESIHFSYDQQKRLSSAQKSETSPQSIDNEKQCAEFPSSGKKPYRTTLSSCTCPDFCRRKLPCKHIYRLAMQCGIIDAEFKSGKNKNTILAEAFSTSELVAEVEKLNDTAQVEMKTFLYNNLNSDIQTYAFDDESCDDSLFKSQLLKEVRTPISVYLRGMRKDEIVALLSRIGIDSGKRKKSELVELCEENYSRVIPLFQPIHTFAFTDKVKPNIRKLYRYLLRKYDWDSYDDFDGTYFKYPHGAHPSDDNPNIYYFPEDEITKLLNKYNCNRCLNGYDVSNQIKEKSFPPNANIDVIKALVNKMSICMTGTSEQCSRSEFSDLMNKMDVTLSDNISDGIACLIVANNPEQSKIEEAQSLNIPILSFGDFIVNVVSPIISD